MRNYVRLFFGTYHIHKDTPLIDADGEIWRGSADEWRARAVTLRSQFESSGYTFTIGDMSPVFYELNHDNFTRIITEFAEVNSLIGFTQGENAIAVFDSPRGREKRHFKLVPIK